MGNLLDRADLSEGSRQTQGLQGSGAGTFINLPISMWHCLPHPSPTCSSSQLLLGQSVSKVTGMAGSVTAVCQLFTHRLILLHTVCT